MNRQQRRKQETKYIKYMDRSRLVHDIEQNLNYIFDPVNYDAKTKSFQPLFKSLVTVEQKGSDYTIYVENDKINSLTKRKLLTIFMRTDNAVKYLKEFFSNGKRFGTNNRI